MTMFRISPRRVRDAVGSTLSATAAAQALDDDDIARRFAAGAWTVLPEPGDGIAGAVRSSLGDARALELLVEGADAQAWASALDDPQLAAHVPQALGRWLPRLSAERILGAFAQGAAHEQTLLLPGDAHWPAGIDDLGPHAPSALWARGDTAALAASDRSVALVGARASTGYGELVTGQLAAGLVERGFAVVSGGAYGIDGTAHRAALASGGMTVAVLAGGLDRFYPAGNDELLRRVAERGCVVAEAPSGTPPTRWRFLARNRVIAALAGATVVVEAGSRSGAINTAGHAAALGRPLGAVPGPVTSGTSTGCHRLLREYSAAVIETPAHAAELVTGPAEEQPMLDALTSDEVRVLDALSSRSTRGVDDLAMRTGMAPRDVTASLALLELAGRAVEVATGWRRDGG